MRQIPSQMKLTLPYQVFHRQFHQETTARAALFSLSGVSQFTPIAPLPLTQCMGELALLHIREDISNTQKY